MDKKRTLVVGLERGTNLKIARALGVTKEMVSKSICGRKNTPLARKIRHVAVSQYGGKEVEIEN